MLVTEISGKMTALEIDAIQDRLEVVLKPMQGLLSNARGYAGTTLLGDGRVSAGAGLEGDLAVSVRRDDDGTTIVLDGKLPGRGCRAAAATAASDPWRRPSTGRNAATCIPRFCRSSWLAGPRLSGPAATPGSSVGRG